MILQILILALLFAWLLYVAFQWFTPKCSSKALASPPSLPPVHLSWIPIPFIGHIYGIATEGSNLYISSLWYAKSRPINHALRLT